MLASERRRHILERVAERQSIEAQTLADELEVSVMTIRRDIKRLEQDGFLRQTYGGATVHITKSVELGFNSRALQFASQKRLIGAFAANVIEPGQVIFLGEGTTTAQFAQFLPPHPRLLVITASLSHASLLCSRNINVIVVGGKLHADELTMTGSIAEATINRFYADVCVLGAAGI
ncbi:MAG TPA: DeoR/GlpR family DNA-binding transcription regulator, partial [Ktedonobacteraceae bacterium]|nr:DeoR/GlpR family DNA-binding transcription regulator [Ktedonobacteraceae bacterium]